MARRVGGGQASGAIIARVEERLTRLLVGAGVSSRAGVRRWDVWGGWWPERLAALASMTGILWTILSNFHVRRWEATGSDFKTLYASAWCLARGLDGYQFDNIAKVFTWGGVTEPLTWFGHAPVYPPMTLALLTPLTLLPMWAAVYAWVLMSAAALACAAASLARFAGEAFGLGRAWRLVLVVAVIAAPLASFGLELGNVSVMVASLSILAVARPEGARVWPRALGLAVALVLKPHMALWVLIALLLVASGRALGRRAMAYAVGLGLALYLFAVSRVGWGAELPGYFAMLHAETAGGSMRAGNHELMEAAAQIVSLDSLLGYGVAHGGLLRGLGAALLVVLAGVLAWTCVRLRAAQGRLQAAAAWCSLGLVATYHRAADGSLLLVMLPWVAARLKARWWDGWAWAVLLAYGALSAGLDYPTMRGMLDRPGLGAVQEFLLYRQGSLAAAALMGLMVWGVVRLRERQGVRGR